MVKKPNIVFILSDDQGAWALGCAGNPEIKTPNLDKLAASGIMFNNFFCASPVCSPARASILTGTIPSVHGVHDWLRGGNLDHDKLSHLKSEARYQDFDSEHKPISYLKDFTTYTDVLAENGYNCALSGKWHLGDSINPQHGFSSWFTIGRGGCEYFNADVVKNGEVMYETDYITDVITDNALTTLDHLCDNDAPFYLSVHYTSPHSPWDEANHQKEYLDMYRDCEFLSVPDVETHPWDAGTAPSGKGEVRKELLRGYFASITSMDHNIGKIINKLEQKGELENTIIIFTSDNGMNMGHHGIWGKGNGTVPQNMFDTSVKVPFIVNYKDKIKPGVCDKLISHYDIFPTLMEYLDLPFVAKQRIIGSSFAGVLCDMLDVNNKTTGDFVVVFDEYGPVRMIRNIRWKYIHRYPYGPHELYDLSVDADEENNLVGLPEYSDIQAKLKEDLDGFYVKHADPKVDGTREAVTGLGQLRKAGTHSKGGKVHFTSKLTEVLVDEA